MEVRRAKMGQLGVQETGQHDKKYLKEGLGTLAGRWPAGPGELKNWKDWKD